MVIAARSQPVLTEPELDGVLVVVSRKDSGVRVLDRDAQPGDVIVRADELDRVWPAVGALLGGNTPAR